MCGIFGLLANKDANLNYSDTHRIINALSKYSERRGKEAVGFAIKNTANQKINVLKESALASQFIKTNRYKSFLKSSLEGCFSNSDSAIEHDFMMIGHTRIATNGQPGSFNNQPVVKNNSVGVHNGIVCNIETLWDKYQYMGRQLEVDTELLVGLIREKIDEFGAIEPAINFVFKEIDGYTSTAILSEAFNQFIFGTNCGSLYYIKTDKALIFTSEEISLLWLSNEMPLKDLIGDFEIKQMSPNTLGILEEGSFDLNISNIEKNGTVKSVAKVDFLEDSKKYTIQDHSNQDKRTAPASLNLGKISKLLEYNIDAIEKIRRCTKCILPETHPFITFDEKGVCNYCKELPAILTRPPKGLEELKKRFGHHWDKKDGANCIVLLSGGRDSCYGLHYIKEELGFTPIAYSYDWGMLTDLGRRNQSRMCGQLGVEHIPVSANIKFKRDNIRKNVNAWLKKPHLGTIGLFMAGDKAFLHFAGVLQKQYDLPIIQSASAYEITTFKYGFAGVEPYSGTGVLSQSKKIKLMAFYAAQAIKNPGYLNASIMDSLFAFKSYLYLKLNMINIFAYIPWEEDVIESTLFNKYDWELSPDTPSSWRIGDGTAAFYNYIYYTVAGFTENDCLRSNQIRMGKMTRETALEKTYKENAPRLESLQWYCDIIGVDLENAIKTINNMPKLYNV